MSLEKRLKAAVDLLGCSPPHRTRGMQKDIVTIHRSAAASNEDGGDDGTDGEFIESLLSVADQLVVPVRCTACNETDGAAASNGNLLGPLSKARCAGWYLPSEFNRDGDHYRCPWCNQYPTALRKKNQSAIQGATFFPSDTCRKVELVANMVFAEYCQLYYGDGSVCSCYAWDVEDGSINIAIIFAQRHRVDESTGNDGGARATTDTSVGNVWTSTHIVTAEPNEATDGLFSYQMQSTFYLDLSPKPSGGVDEWGEPMPAPDHMKGCSNRCSGFVTHIGKPFSNKKHLAKASKASANVPHVSEIGAQIQKIENRIRGLVGEIYFSRMGQAVAKFRGAGKKQKVMVVGTETVKPSSPDAASPTDARPKMPPLPPGVAFAGNSSQPPAQPEPEPEAAAQTFVWEETLDTEGNLFYYSPTTEESVWEHPGGSVKPLKKRKNKSRSQEALDEAPAATEEEPVDDLEIEEDAEGDEEVLDLEVEEEEKEQTVEELLDSLSLAGEVSSYDYARTLRKSSLRIKTIWDLVALGADEGQDEALTEFIEAYGDRKKICKWIRKNQPAEEEVDDLVVEDDETLA